MTSKIKVDKIVEAMKQAVKDAKKPKVSVPKIANIPVGPLVRDMRKEAMDMGSHGANDYFKDTEDE